jgi:hypothetical protein
MAVPSAQTMQHIDARRILSIDGLDWSQIKAAVLAIGACCRRDWYTKLIEAIKGDPREAYQKLAICRPCDQFTSKDWTNKHQTGSTRHAEGVVATYHHHTDARGRSRTIVSVWQNCSDSMDRRVRIQLYATTSHGENG